MLMPDWVVAQQKEIGTRFSKMKIWYDRFCRPLSCRCSLTSRDIKLVCNLGGKVLLKYDVNMWVMPNWPYHVTYRDDCERYLERWLKGCGWTMVHTCGQRWFDTEGRGNLHCFQQLFDRCDVKKRWNATAEKNRFGGSETLSVEILCCCWIP